MVVVPRCPAEGPSQRLAGPIRSVWPAQEEVVGVAVRLPTDRLVRQKRVGFELAVALLASDRAWRRSPAAALAGDRHCPRVVIGFDASGAGGSRASAPRPNSSVGRRWNLRRHSSQTWHRYRPARRAAWICQ